MQQQRNQPADNVKHKCTDIKTSNEQRANTLTCNLRNVLHINASAETKEGDVLYVQKNGSTWASDIVGWPWGSALPLPPRPSIEVGKCFRASCIQKVISKNDCKYDFNVGPSPGNTTSEQYDVKYDFKYVFKYDFSVGPSHGNITSEHMLLNMILNMISM